MIRACKSGVVKRMSLIAREFISSGASLTLPMAIATAFRKTARGFLKFSLVAVSDTRGIETLEHTSPQN